MRRNEPCKNCTEYWAPSQVCRETEGERLHDPDVQHDHPDGILCATSTPRPRPGVGGRGDRRSDVCVWGDATVACCRAVVRRLCGLCRGVRSLPVSCVLLVRWTRFAPPAASKPSQAPSSNGTKLDRVRGMVYGTALCTSIVHFMVSGLCATVRPARSAVTAAPQRR